MSRIGKQPIILTDKTTVTYKDRVVVVKGEKGTLKREIHPTCDLKIDGKTISVEIVSNVKKASAYQGLVRALVANMVTGVSKGFERKLEINGIGYRAELKGKGIVLNLGYSKPVEFDLPDNVSASVEKNIIVLSSIDKELVGETAARIRMIRPPEPYKGKGVKYAEEHIQKKAGKTGAK